MSTTRDPVLWLGAAIACFYIFAPHSVHMKFSAETLFTTSFPHSAHVLFGVAVAIGCLIYAHKQYNALGLS
jgi:membrane associated rhomboid family serine protease